jgi:hypothetical protein
MCDACRSCVLFQAETLAQEAIDEVVMVMLLVIVLG